MNREFINDSLTIEVDTPSMCELFKDLDKRTKKCLGIAVILVIFIFALSAAFYVYYYSKWAQPASYRSFSVSGEGKVVAVPDVAQFTFSVITEGGLGIADLQKENTVKINKIIKYVKDNQVDAKDIKTQGYSVSPRYQYSSCGRNEVCLPPKIVGYTITQSVLVKIRDFDKIGDLLSGVVTNGANSVSELSFTIDDPTQIQNQAREEAIAKAKDKAKAIADAGGFGLGKLLSIEEGGYVPVPMYDRAYGIGGGGETAPAASPVIEPGSQEVTVDVTLRYEIK